MHTELSFTSVHEIPGTNKSAAFTPNTSEVFKEERDIARALKKSLAVSPTSDLHIVYTRWRN